MLRAQELQRRLDAEGVPIMVLTTHPGAINSGTVFYSPSVVRFINVA